MWARLEKFSKDLEYHARLLIDIIHIGAGNVGRGRLLASDTTNYVTDFFQSATAKKPDTSPRREIQPWDEDDRGFVYARRRSGRGGQEEGSCNDDPHKRHLVHLDGIRTMLNSLTSMTMTHLRMWVVEEGMTRMRRLTME